MNRTGRTLWVFPEVFTHLMQCVQHLSIDQTKFKTCGLIAKFKNWEVKVCVSTQIGYLNRLRVISQQIMLDKIPLIVLIMETLRSDDKIFLNTFVYFHETFLSNILYLTWACGRILLFLGWMILVTLKNQKQTTEFLQ